LKRSARLASGAFCFAVRLMTSYECIMHEFPKGGLKREGITMTNSDILTSYVQQQASISPKIEDSIAFVGRRAGGQHMIALTGSPLQVPSLS
jgi:hypothetical protein